MPIVRLDSPIDVDGFRRHARALVMRRVRPDDVQWLCEGDAFDSGDLWSSGASEPSGSSSEVSTSMAPSPFSDLNDAPRFNVPASFVDLCRRVLLHRDPQRFALMYRLLWRVREDPRFWHDELNSERRLAEQWAREVGHEIHKMRAFVRFTPVESDSGTRHIAWFEPEHHVVEANAPFFVRRFAQMRWAIVTPLRSIEWDGERLIVGPGGDRRDAPPPDAGAGLWLTYYRNIFNPARLKIDMMVREMPRRYWKNLPEAALIEPLIASADQRAQDMVDAEPTSPRKSTPMRWARGAESPQD